MCALIHICSDNVIRLQQTIFPCPFMPFDFFANYAGILCCQRTHIFCLTLSITLINLENLFKPSFFKISQIHRYNPANCTQGLQSQVIPHILRIQLKPCLIPLCVCMQKHHILRQVIYCENSFPIVNHTISPLLLFTSRPKLICEVSRLMRVERLSKKSLGAELR